MRPKPVKFRFGMWKGMRIPFNDAIDRFLRAGWWGRWEDLIRGAKTLIQLPLVFGILLFVIAPLITFAVAKNNARIVWRCCKRACFRLCPGKEEAK